MESSELSSLLPMELFVTKEQIIIADLERAFSNCSNDNQPSVSPAGPHPSKLSWAPLKCENINFNKTIKKTYRKLFLQIKVLIKYQLYH